MVGIGGFAGGCHQGFQRNDERQCLAGAGAVGFWLTRLPVPGRCSSSFRADFITSAALHPKTGKLQLGLVAYHTCHDRLHVIRRDIGYSTMELRRNTHNSPLLVSQCRDHEMFTMRARRPISVP